MVRDAAGRGRMWRCTAGDKVEAVAGSLVAWFTTTHACEVVADGERLELPPWHLAWQRLEREHRWVVREGSGLWHLGVEPLAGPR
jgi:hypothetical protein